MAKVSVIVPVYNTESYLEKCLDSLVNQTLEEIEIIVVNDGSTDGSASIIKKYLKKYPTKILSITKKNEGASCARNKGLEIVKSKYVGFVDSDDYIAPTMYEDMYKVAETGYDIVVCSTNIVYPNKTEVVPSHFSLSADYKDYVIAPPMPCNKLFKRELFTEDFLFRSGTFYEDLELIPTFALKTQKIAFVEEPYYYYVQRDGSTMHQIKFQQKIYDIFPVLENIMHRFEEAKAQKDYEKELEYLAIEHLLYSSAIRLCPHKKERKEGFQKINTWIKQYYPTWPNNPYYLKKSWKFRLVCNLTSKNHTALVYLLTLVKRGL